jgi:two-component system, cell cycle sensor histidine kinase and response regulator CckA
MPPVGDGNDIFIFKTRMGEALMTQKTNCMLVIDDDPVIRHYIAAVFSTSEFQVLEAGDGLEALKRIDVFGASIDILLVDVVMPKLNGAELARVVLSCHPTIKIIFMSGYPDDVVNRHGIPASKMRFLKKPYTPHMLEQTVRDALKT